MKETKTYKQPSRGYINLKSHPRVLQAFRREFRGHGFDYIPHDTDIEIDASFKKSIDMLERPEIYEESVRELILKGMDEHADKEMDILGNILSMMVELCRDFYIKGFADGKVKESLYRKDLEKC